MTKKIVAQKLKSEFIRSLHLEELKQTQGRTFISSASGLIEWKKELWAVADDEQFLVSFKKSYAEPLHAWQVIEGKAWSPKKEKRKKQKSDLESLTTLGDNAVLAIGSGSKPTRNKGYLVNASKSVQEIDFTPLYERLMQHFPKLNIEGAAETPESFFLAQRGTSHPNHKSQNALIELNKKEFLEDLDNECITDRSLRSLHFLDFGRLKKVSLSITDLIYDSKRNGFFYSAVAENTDSTFFDGRCFGSVIGFCDLRGQIKKQQELEDSYKVEGLCFDSPSPASKTTQALLFVNDEDNVHIPSELRRVVFKF